MGCNVGTSRANSLRDVQQEVNNLKRRLDNNEESAKLDNALKTENAQKQQEISDLKRRLEESDREKADLRSQLDLAQKQNSTPLLSESKLLYRGDAETENLKAGLAQMHQVERSEAPPELTPQELPPPESPPHVAQGDAVEPLGQPFMLVPGVVNVEETQVIPEASEPLPAINEAPPDIPPPEVTEQAPNLTIDPEAHLETAETRSIHTVIDETNKYANEIKKQEDCKMTGTMISDTSTCTPANTVTPANAGPVLTCHQCGVEKSDVVRLFVDSSDLQRYCERCWMEYYGTDQRPINNQLVPVEPGEAWADDKLAQEWAAKPIVGWPPSHFGLQAQTFHKSDGENEIWSNVAVRVRREIVGAHAREYNNLDRPVRDEVLRRRYKCGPVVGEGHFTKAFLAEDLKEGGFVCIKRHRNLSMDALTDFLVLGTRLREVDEDGAFFPRLVDAFYDIVGFTVETLLEGVNCLAVMTEKPGFFGDLRNLRVVAKDGLRGLEKLERAGIVHNDVKADNLMWLGSREPGDVRNQVRIVDFGCARLDCREEPKGRNWALGEGGAGHLGKWSPEMTLRLAIDHKGDVWGFAVCLCELHCHRNAWRSEVDTAEVILAQGLGLANQQDGLPTAMMKRSGLDIRLLYTPQPKHFPLRRSVMGKLEVLRPQSWGLDQILGENWQRTEKTALGELLTAAFVIDPVERPPASELLKMKFLQPEWEVVQPELEVVSEEKPVLEESQAPLEQAALTEAPMPLD